MGRRLFRTTLPALYIVAALSLCATGYGLATPRQSTQFLCAIAGVITAICALTGAEFLRRRPTRRLSAIEDPTGLTGRAQLLADLDQALDTATPDRPVALVLLDLVGFKEYNDTFGYPAGDALLKRLANKLSRVVATRGSAYRLDGDEFAALLSVEEDTGHLADLVASALVEEGDGFAVAPCYGTALLPQEGNTASDALRVANERMYALKYSLRPSAGALQSNEVLMETLAKRGPDCGDHLHGLAELVEAVARKLGIDLEDLEQVRLAAELHDVGKTALPTTILQKRFPLDVEEREFIQHHSMIGERILHAAPALHKVARIIRWTHERYDGAGYPDHLSGAEIPIGARIISVCDAFDAMISNRPYRKAMSIEEATDELQKNAGSQFDPLIVDAFCAVMEERERFFLAA
jgi:diguanylate cyclase (GGDEF)-like protein/putative nucleotidyltransferase with HDIG domain